MQLRRRPNAELLINARDGDTWIEELGHWEKELQGDYWKNSPPIPISVSNRLLAEVIRFKPCYKVFDHDDGIQSPSGFNGSLAADPIAFKEAIVIYHRYLVSVPVLRLVDDYSWRFDTKSVVSWAIGVKPSQIQLPTADERCEFVDKVNQANRPWERWLDGVA